MSEKTEERLKPIIDMLDRYIKLRKVLPKLFKVLEDKLKLQPVLIGGMALTYFGYERATTDIDILLSVEDYEKLKEEGEKFGIVHKHGNTFIFEGMDVDILEGDAEGDDLLFTKEVRNVEHEPTLVGFIFLKILAGRRRDLADIEELLKITELTQEQKKKLRKLLNDELYEVWLREFGLELE